MKKITLSFCIVFVFIFVGCRDAKLKSSVEMQIMALGEASTDQERLAVEFLRAKLVREAFEKSGGIKEILNPFKDTPESKSLLSHVKKMREMTNTVGKTAKESTRFDESGRFLGDRSKYFSQIQAIKLACDRSWTEYQGL